MRNAGVKTLTDLFGLVNVYGHRWHNRVPGLGPLRAGRIVAWLRSQQEGLQLVLRDGLDEPVTRRALRRGAAARQLSMPQRYGLAPLEQLALPPELLGLSGVFRSFQPNTLGASDDLQAVTRWLTRFERLATLRSYRKEVERLLLWCTGVRRKALSSVDALDCQAYRAFLQAVPASWIHPLPLERTDPLWRPFRRAPSPASQKQALVILQTMFEGLCDAGYLVANPMRSVMKTFALPVPKVQTQRAFGEREWAHILGCVDAEPAGPARRRLRCLLELLVTSGVRRDELTRARRGDLRLETLPELPPTWVLTVTGKRNKQREVPLADDMVALLDAHARDALGADGAEPGEGVQGRLEFADPAQRPLIFALGASVAQWQVKDGQLRAVAIVEEGGGALSGAGIYAVLKRFFARAADSAEAAGLQRGRLEAASTHWLRHTFVRQALVDSAPLEVVSELAGHASIDTTSIYSTQELARKITVVRGLRRRPGA
jgi:site-specific recombinase XerD